MNNYIRSFKSGDGIAMYVTMAIVLVLFCFITWQTYKPLPDSVLKQLFDTAIAMAKTPADLEEIAKMYRPEPPDWKAIAGQLGTLIGMCTTLFKFSQAKSNEKIAHNQSISK